MNDKLKQRLKNIKILILDIDGTLTDGSIYYGHDGEVFKRFFAKDGMGITLLRKSGIKTAFLTSEESEINIKRSNKLKIDYLVQGSRNKSGDLRDIVEKAGLNLDECAYCGDDINDYHVIKIVGISFAPKDAVEEIKKNVDYVCKNNGGRGAVREISEMILLSQNLPIILQENW